MEALLLYVARNNDHTKVWREEYQRHRDAQKRRCLAYVSRGGHNSSSYSIIMKKIEKDWPPAISLKYLRDRIKRACRDNDERVTTYVMDILKGPEENMVTHYKGMWCKGRHYRVQKVDENRQTFDCGIVEYFIVDCQSHVHDENIKTDTL